MAGWWANRRPLRAAAGKLPRGGRLAVPESVFRVALDHDGKGAVVALTGGGMRNHRAGLLGRFHRLVDVLDLEVGPHDRLLMSRQRPADADQAAVPPARHPCLPEVGIRGTKERPCTRS